MSLRKVIFARNFGNIYRNFRKPCQNANLQRNCRIDKPTFVCGKINFCSDCPPKCWQCDFPYKSELFCTKCKALQKLPKDLDYFDIIGVRKDFDVSVDELQAKYRQLQNLLHPDRFGNRSDKEQELSENISSILNKAYSTLLNPLNRGLYLLKLNDIEIPEGTTNLEPEFLMEVMEKNEEIEKASRDKDKILKFMNENRKTLSDLKEKVSEAFRNNDLELAKKLLTRMKYFVSIESRLKKSKDDLGIVE